MTAISFAKSVKALAKGAKTMLVVAPAKVLSRRKLPKLLGKRLDDTILELAKEVSVGAMGASATTLTTKEPGRLTVCALPNAVSRHNSAARAESIRRLVSGAGLADKGKTAILLVLDEAEHLTAAVNAVGRALPLYSAKSGKKSARRVQILAVDGAGKPISVDAYTRAVLECARDSAELVDTPPTELNPEAYAERAIAVLEALPNVEVETIVGDELLEHGLGGIHAVGRCAVNAPRMVLATYTPPEPGSDRHVALVGKGVTYDTGGLHLKGRGFMEGMKCDMGGSAAVFGAFRVLATVGCPHKVSLLMMLAENAIGPASFKPDDIITMHSGKTVEINNTDAEGRLLLGDGVSWASRVLECDTVYDAATLTGAQLIATGKMHAAVMSNEGRLEAGTVAAGHRTGDLAHPLLFMPEVFQGEFPSKVADMCNSVKDRMNAQSSCAGQFVYAHVAEGTRWCHVDLAGPAFPNGRGTGYGVALLSAAVLDDAAAADEPA